LFLTPGIFTTGGKKKKIIIIIIIITTIIADLRNYVKTTTFAARIFVWQECRWRHLVIGWSLIGQC